MRLHERHQPKAAAEDETTKQTLKEHTYWPRVTNKATAAREMAQWQEHRTPHAEDQRGEAHLPSVSGLSGHCVHTMHRHRITEVHIRIK